MSDFVNTVDIVGDDVLIDSLITKSISGSFNDDKITSIRSNAFSYCTNLESVCFPNATSIDGGAFRGSGLKAITPDTFPLVTQIRYLYGSYVFGESALETVDWPSLTTQEDYNFFTNCKSLRSVNLPNWIDVGSWGWENTFTGCTSLTDVNLPLVSKCPYFNGCTSLETITLPLVTNTSTFNGCTSLRVIDLPSCTSIETYNNPFANCPLDALILRSTTMCTFADNRNAFHNSGIANGTGYIYVPRELVNSYKSATNWNSFASQIRPLEDFTVDGTITGAMREHCESLALNVNELTFTDANNQTLTPTGVFGILDGQMVWNTSDKTVARVNSNGVVVPTGEGTATITVTCGGRSATCVVTVGAGIDFASANILHEVVFNVGYVDDNGSIANTTSADDTFTNKFDISEYVGESIIVTLLDVKSTPSCSRICYYNSNNAFISRINGTATGNNLTMISTVPDNAVYAVISINKSKGFSGIDITCNGEQIGCIDYTS